MAARPVISESDRASSLSSVGLRTLLVGAVLTTVGACSTSMSNGTTNAAPSGSGWVREISPFPVIDEQGEAYGHAFLGGFNLPRPQLVDIDLDGDQDLFVQEVSGSVMFFEHTDDPDLPYQWRSDRYQDLEIGEWYRFVDLDRDGDPDLLAEQPFSYIRYYRNDGEPGQPRFVVAADSLKDTEGRPLFSDRQNIPNATDIDCDGQMDFLIGRLVGTVTRYEETGTDENGVPRFRHLTDRFEDIEIVADVGSNRHGANTMALGDIDQDGDVDMFWGDFFEPGLLFIENRGTCNGPNLRATPDSFPDPTPLRTSGYNAPTVGDYDTDGDQDLLVGVLGGAYNPNTTTIDNFHLLEQTDGGLFEQRTARFISMLDVGSESVPTLIDLDDDGDLDLLVGNKIEPDDPQNGKVFIFRNEGSPSAPSYRADGTFELGGGYHFIPAFGDLDADGDLDAIVGTWEDQVRLYMDDTDDGMVNLTLADSMIVTLTRGRNSTPALGDLDGDGDLDLLIGESSGTINYYRNDGSATAPDFVLVTDEFADIDVGRRSLPVLHDLDDDGDLDLVVGSEGEGAMVFRNVGSTAEAVFEADGTLPIGNFGFAAPAFGDIDADGDDDIVLGGAGGGLWFYRNR